LGLPSGGAAGHAIGVSGVRATKGVSCKFVEEYRALGILIPRWTLGGRVVTNETYLPDTRGDTSDEPELGVLAMICDVDTGAPTEALVEVGSARTAGEAEEACRAAGYDAPIEGGITKKLGSPSTTGDDPEKEVWVVSVFVRLDRSP
jgi:hypothetical protein